MRILALSVSNYKSLRNVALQPASLTVLAGSNGAGKSNFADFLDFISEVYRHGLGVAVASKGGYENIAFRRMRRTKSPISMRILVELPGHGLTRRRAQHASAVTAEHSFSFLAKGSSIRADYEILSESLSIRHATGNDELLALSRHNHRIRFETVNTNREYSQSIGLDLSDIDFFLKRERSFEATELLITSIGSFIPILAAFNKSVGQINVYQIHPNISRDDGVPSPTPELTRYGSNLPAVIDSLKKGSGRRWDSILEYMRVILPSLSDVSVEYTPTRRLGLYFHEEGIGRPWSVGDISDGTIQTLAILVALFDPRSKALLIEELENSIHPWIVRSLIDACKRVAKTKPVFLTTHSPVLLGIIEPADIWIVSRVRGETRITPLLQLDQNYQSAWESGQVSTFDFLDSGIIPEAVPPQFEDQVSRKQ